jgi:PIN domain nuclease of toxin-antitoxin system
VILLDTNALIWLHGHDERVAALARGTGRLYISPASILELQFLSEVGRVRLKREATLAQVVHDDRWAIDDPPSIAWFEEAIGIGWTRDPFDRLLVAHARLRKWPLATGDRRLMEEMRRGEYVEL